MSNPTPARRLPIAIALLGLTVPIAPRVLVPLIVPGDYIDDLPQMLSEPLGRVLFLLFWTELPFLLLAAACAVALSRGAGRRASWGFAGACAAGLATGYVIHAPETQYGMDFGVAGFPLYALVAMPLGYAVASLVADSR